MTQRYYIPNGQTISPLMSLDWDGAQVSVLFFDGSGNPANVSGIPAIYRSQYETGEIWQQVEPLSSADWRFNGAAARIKIDLAGVTGYTTYQVVIWRTDDPMTLIPDGAFNGRRAMTIQTYDETNKKVGTQWEASRLVTIASNAAANNVYSIIRTGSKSVDLKSRTLGYTGLGVIGNIYKNPVYTGGTADPWFNMNPSYLGSQPEAQLLVGFTLGGNLTSKGTQCGAPIYGIGPDSIQSRGSTPKDYGSNRILDEPNTAYLLEIVSDDTQSQRVTARLEIYEGGLDLPLRA